jgi:hypothetical protein
MNAIVWTVAAPRRIPSTQIFRVFNLTSYRASILSGRNGEGNLARLQVRALRTRMVSAPTQSRRAESVPEVQESLLEYAA